MASHDDFDPERDLTLERVFDAPRDVVWAAWTEPEQLKQWWCPRPWQTPYAEIDLRPGGVFHTVMRGPGGEEEVVRGCYLEVVPGERLVFTDALGPGYRPGGKAFITAVITFSDADGGTRYHARVMHADAATRQKHEEMGFTEGWSAAATQCEEVARSIAKARR